MKIQRIAGRAALLGPAAVLLAGWAGPGLAHASSASVAASSVAASSASPAASSASPAASSASPTASPSSPVPAPSSTGHTAVPVPSTSAPSPLPSTTPKVTPSPQPTSSSPSPSPSSPRPKHPVGDQARLSVSVQPLAGQGVITAGTAARYAIFAGSRQATARGVLVSVRAAGAVTGAPGLSSCPAGGATSCQIGSLPAGRQDELLASVGVSAGARSGQQVTLIATVSAPGAATGSAAATFTVGRTAASATLTASFPVITSPASGVLVAHLFPPVNPSGLFPTVSPSASPGAPAAAPARNRPARVTTAAAILPLGAGLAGGQLIGLTLLALAVAFAVLRFSVRMRQPQPASGGSDGEGAPDEAPVP